MNYVLCLFDKNELSDAWTILDKAERCYNDQKEELSQKEKQFFEDNLDKLKKKRDK